MNFVEHPTLLNCAYEGDPIVLVDVVALKHHGLGLLLLLKSNEAVCDAIKFELIHELLLEENGLDFAVRLKYLENKVLVDLQ